jgi:hypothetical protein
MRAIKSIQNRIYEIRGERVMLDKDLAALYETPTKSLNLAVKRNIKRFPKDFMFQLTQEEFENVRLQIETPESSNSLRFQIETSKGSGGNRYLPYWMKKPLREYGTNGKELDLKNSTNWARQDSHFQLIDF